MQLLVLTNARLKDGYPDRQTWFINGDQIIGTTYIEEIGALVIRMNNGDELHAIMSVEEAGDLVASWRALPPD